MQNFGERYHVEFENFLVLYTTINLLFYFVALQARLVELDTPRRLENLQKLDELKKHLMDLEKQVIHKFWLNIFIFEFVSLYYVYCDVFNRKRQSLLHRRNNI